MGLDPGSGLVEDAQWYTNEYGVSLEEAVRRLKLGLDSISELDQELMAQEPDTFAGLWIQHEPEFVVFVRFTQDGEQTIRPYVEGEPLESLVEVLPASATLEELESAQVRARYFVDGLGIPAESGIELENNRAYINVTDKERLVSALQAASVSLPDEVVVNQIDELLGPQEDIYGGLRLYHRSGGFECTSGFSMVRANGDTGTSTAGHCRDALDFRGSPINHQPPNSAFYGPYDVQFHLTPGITDRPVVTDGDSTLRPIYQGKGRLEYAVGNVACHMGQGGIDPEYVCGEISDRSYTPNAPRYN